jgi:5-methylcytosine-specific restriction endonuclease McrA
MTKPTCYHQKKSIVWSSVNTHGEELVVRQLRYQCSDCGELLPNALPHSMATRSTPEVDMDAIRRWASYRDGNWQKRRAERYQIEQQRQTEWRVKYEDYLRSEQWQSKRRLVFQRCAGICEGCRQAKATQVHHLTYEHLGDELLWELAAVCRECHERVHEISLRNFARQRHRPEIDGERPILRDVS